MGRTISSFIQSIIIGLGCNPIIVRAAEEAAETADSSRSNPIAAFIALIVFIVVTYTVFKAMYSGTTIIGTRNGIAYEKGRMLFIPSIIGLIAAGIVYKILDFLSVILIIVAIGIGLFFIIKKFMNTNTVNNATENKSNKNIAPINPPQNNTNMNNEIRNDDFRECPSCHNKIHINSKFCKYCGKSV